MSVTDQGAAEPVEAYDFDLDHHGEHFRENNYALYGEMRDTCPVAHSSAHGGFWLLFSYEAAFDALRDTDVFSSGVGKNIPQLPYMVPIIPIDSDPPEHERYRKMLHSWFSPTASKALTEQIRTMTNELIDDFVERGEAEIVAELTSALPAVLILRMLGFDESRWREWQGWIHSIVHEQTHDPAAARAAYEAVFADVHEEMRRRRENGLTDDLMSDILRGPKDDGPEATDDQVFGTAFLMLLAGMDTTSGLTSNTFVRLCERPDLRRRLVAEPEILDSATEEFLRHDTPTQGLPRVVTRDIEFHGRQLKTGERVVCMYASANRDPAMFENPDEIDFDRNANKQMAFGVGKHRCLGSNLARIMFQVMVTEVLRRLPDYELDGPYDRFEDAASVYAVSRLPVRFAPGAREVGTG